MRQHETIRVQHDTTHDNTTNNTSQHNTTRVQHDTTRHHTSKTQDSTSIIRYNTSMTRPNTSAKEARTAKIGLYFTFFIIELYIFLIFLEMVNIVLHAILFQPFEYQGVYIRPDMLLSNQGHCDVLRKDCNSDAKDVYIPHSSFVFYRQQLQLLV